MKTEKEYNKVFDYVLKLMESGKLNRGSRLPSERKISTDLNISRNSTREAMRSLEMMGITESIQGSGNYLTGNISNSISQMIRIMIMFEQFNESEVYSFRKMLEKSVCSCLIESDSDLSDVIKKAEDILNKEYVSSNEKSKADKDFHYLLINATGNRLIISMMEAVSNVYRDFIESVIEGADEVMRKKFHNAHVLMLNGLRERDTEQCFKAIDFHYELINHERLRKI